MFEGIAVWLLDKDGAPKGRLHLLVERRVGAVHDGYALACQWDRPIDGLFENKRTDRSAAPDQWPTLPVCKKCLRIAGYRRHGVERERDVLLAFEARGEALEKSR